MSKSRRILAPALYRVVCVPGTACAGSGGKQFSTRTATIIGVSSCPGETGCRVLKGVADECAAGEFGTPIPEPLRRDARGKSSSRQGIFIVKTRTSANNRDYVSEVRPAVQHAEVPADRAGQRIDNFLATRLKGVPKSMVYRLLRTGQVRVNGRRAKPDQRLCEGDDVRIPPVRVAERDAPEPPAPGRMADIEAAIIHEDREFLVIDKPSGVASHGGSGINFGVIELLRAARPRETLELVHRLDRDTSGVLVLSRKRSALTALQAAIREGRVEKRYLALIQGAPAQAKMPVDLPLRKSVLQGGERMVRVDPDGKPSRSTLRTVSRHGAATLIEVALETGRTHQIRVHCAHIGHPVAGDEKYGDADFNRALRAKGLKRLFLHAARFEFALGERAYGFSAPLPQELSKVLDALDG